MRFKFYLRGIGIGILFSTIVLSVAFWFHKPAMSDEEVIIRAKELGMEMVEEEKESIEHDSTGNEKVNSMMQENASENTQLDTEEEIVVSSNAIITITKGEVCRTLAEDLEQCGLIDDAEDFRIYMGKKGKDDDIRAGEFEIPYGSTYDEIISILMK